MTLQQMRYAISVADTGSISKAAEMLYISQPSLSTAIYKLEEELAVKLFIRTTKGVEISSEGYVFLEAAKRIVKQSDTVLRQYKAMKDGPFMSFRISSVHIGLAIRVFMKLLDSIENPGYDFCFFDRSTPQVIQDLVRQSSEIGVIDISTTNRHSIYHMLKVNQLEFKPLIIASPHALVRKGHPLAGKSKASLSEFCSYPFVFYEMDEKSNMDYVNAFVLKNHAPEKRLRGTDRSTLISLLHATDGYAICCGFMDSDIYTGLKTILLEDVEDYMEIGWIRRKNIPPSPLAQRYLSLLDEEVFQALGQNNCDIGHRRKL